MFCKETTPQHISVVATCQIISELSPNPATVMYIIFENCRLCDKSMKQLI